MAECIAFSQLSSSLCLSTKTLFSSSTLLHLSRPKGQCAPCSGRSCFNSVWKEQIQGQPLLQSLTTLQPFFPAGTFGISHSAVLRHLDQPISFLFFSFLFQLKIPYYLSSTSSWISQLIPMRWRLSSDTGSMRICVPPTLTFLWASFSTSTTWLGAAWATFFPHKTAQEQQEGVRPLFKCKPLLQLFPPLPERAEAFSSH